MKYLLILFLGITINPVFSQNIYYLINDSLDKTEYINYDNNTINFNSDRLGFDFNFNSNSFEILTSPDYKNFVLVKGNDNLHLILDVRGSKGDFSKIRTVKGDYEIVKKEVSKGKLGKKTQIINSKEPESYKIKGFDFVSESMINYEIKNREIEREQELRRKKRELEKKKTIENYYTQTKLKDYVGTYKVTFLNHSSYTVNHPGIIYVTEEGITVKCEGITSLNLIRSSHNKSFPKSSGYDEGDFYCKITKGYGDDLFVSINKETKSIGITRMNGRNSTTSSGTITDFIP